jgi:hypothetical protein
MPRNERPLTGSEQLPQYRVGAAGIFGFRFSAQIKLPQSAHDPRRGQIKYLAGDIGGGAGSFQVIGGDEIRCWPAFADQSF